ncbi:MAG: protein kinase [Blastocatellia bacterium]|nr:protein kinase [Blastocatellia bacterium]
MLAGTLLIVDDIPSNIDVLEEMLTELGFTILSAPNGQQALETLQTAHPDVILLDIAMPDLNGFEVCQQLKANPATAEIPVIFVTAMGDPADQIRGFEVGGADYITKPFHWKEVLARIENQLRISQLQSELKRRNQELSLRNEELERAHQQADRYFSVLSETLQGMVLDHKYFLEHKIGEGGFGVVYQARHLELQSPVAVKILRPVSGIPSHDELERFRREGMVACHIHHPNAVKVLDSNISDSGVPYIVMELLTGHTLRDEMNDKRRLSFNRSIEIIVPVCMVLARAHQTGIIHRDIKPENIFLHETDSGEVVKVLDFGIAKVIGDLAELATVYVTQTASSVIQGTPTYMAPERLANKPCGPSADVYGIAAVLYEMLAGFPPFHSSKQDLTLMLVQHLTCRPVPLRTSNPEVPVEIESLIDRALAKEPEERPTAQGLATALQKLVARDLNDFVLDETEPLQLEPNSSYNAKTLKYDSHLEQLFYDQLDRKPDSDEEAGKEEVERADEEKNVRQ